MQIARNKKYNCYNAICKNTKPKYPNNDKNDNYNKYYNNNYL